MIEKNKLKEEAFEEKVLGRKRPQTLEHCRKLALLISLRLKEQNKNQPQTNKKEGLGERGPFGPHLTINLPKPKTNPSKKQKRKKRKSNTKKHKLLLFLENRFLKKRLVETHDVVKKVFSRTTRRSKPITTKYNSQTMTGR